MNKWANEGIIDGGRRTICMPPAPAATTGLKTGSPQKARGRLSAHLQRLGSLRRASEMPQDDSGPTRRAARLLRKTVWRVLKKLEIEILYDPAFYSWIYM